MSTVIGNGDFTQTVFLSGLTAGPGTPSVFVHGLLLVVPDTSIDVRCVFMGQTEPPLVRLIDADTVTNLGLNALDYTFHLKVVRNTDAVVKVDTTVSYALQADATATLTHFFSTTTFDEEGEHEFQFRAVRLSDNRTLIWHKEGMTVRER